MLVSKATLDCLTLNMAKLTEAITNDQVQKKYRYGYSTEEYSNEEIKQLIRGMRKDLSRISKAVEKGESTHEDNTN